MFKQLRNSTSRLKNPKSLRTQTVSKLSVIIRAVIVMQLHNIAVGGTGELDPGDLDPQFGNAGYVTTDFGGAYDGVDAVAIQQDGRST